MKSGMLQIQIDACSHGVGVRANLVKSEWIRVAIEILRSCRRCKHKGDKLLAHLKPDLSFLPVEPCRQCWDIFNQIRSEANASTKH